MVNLKASFSKSGKWFNNVGLKQHLAQELEKDHAESIDELTPEKDEIKYNSEFGYSVRRTNLML